MLLQGGLIANVKLHFLLHNIHCKLTFTALTFGDIFILEDFPVAVDCLIAFRGEALNTIHQCMDVTSKCFPLAAEEAKMR